MKTNLATLTRNSCRKINTETSSGLNFFTDEEFYVAEIMVSLSDLIPKFDTQNKALEIPVRHSKRKRTASPPSQSPLPSLQKPKYRLLVQKQVSMNKRVKKLPNVNDDEVVCIISPPPSSRPSIGKPYKHVEKQVPIRKLRNELELKLYKLTECKKELLLGIEKAKDYYEKQKALNLRLKEYLKSNEILQSTVNNRLSLEKQENEDTNSDSRENHDDDDDVDDDDQYDDDEDDHDDKEHSHQEILI